MKELRLAQFSYRSWGGTTVRFMLAFFVLCSKAAFARGDGTFQTPLRIDVPHNKYTSLRVVDLDDDGVPDLIGVNSLDGMVLVALLDASGKARAQDSLPAGAQPMDILVGPIDGDGILDLAVPCAGSNYISIFFGRGGGAFATAKNVPTIDKPVDLALQDLDGDAQSDLA